MSMYKHAISLTCPNADTTVRDLATLQSSCPSVTPGVTGNYFSIASAERLGTAQAAQFQSGNQTGNDWHWGSRLNESGEVLWDEDTIGVENPVVYTLAGSTKVYVARNRSSINGATKTAYIDENTEIQIGNNDTGLFQADKKRFVENNSRAEMPRSYNFERNNLYGAYYNYYSITAESGTWSTSNSAASDSICPAGWELPNDFGEGSWTKLVRDSYGYITSAGNGNLDASTKMRRLPLSASLPGDYLWHTGLILNQDSSGFFWSNTATNNAYSRHLRLDKNGLADDHYNNNKPYGFSGRCVKKL